MKFTGYTYAIRLTMIDGNDVYDLTNKVKYVLMKDKYFDNVYTIFKIEFVINKDIYEIIRLRGPELRYILNIDKYESSNSNDTRMDMSSKFISNIKLKPMNNIITPLNTSERLDTIKNNLDVITVTLEMFQEDNIIYNKTIFNNIYDKASVLDVFSLIYSKIDKEVILETPENGKRYDQIVLPPLNIFMATRFIQQHYGAYNRGIVTYMGPDYCYVKSKFNNNNTPQPVGEYRDVRIQAKIDVDSNSLEFKESSAIDHDAKCYYLRLSLDKIFVNDNKRVDEEILGNKNSVFSRTLDNSEYKLFEVEDNDVEEKRKFYINNVNNDMLTNELFNKLNNNYTVSFTYDSIDLNILKCNKIIHFFFDQSDTGVMDTNNVKYQVKENEVLFKTQNGVATVSGSVVLTQI